MAKEILYQRMANILQQQINSGVYKAGDRLPSLRTVQKNYGLGLNTVKQAFLELEARSLIESRPKSGYYVSEPFAMKLAIPSMNEMKSTGKAESPEDLISKVYHTLENKNMRQLSLGLADSSLLPIARLNRGVIKAIKELPDSGTAHEPIQGSVNLRRNLAKWALVMEGKLNEDDIVTTAGTTSAISHCLMAVTQPGDTIAVESPVYFGILQVANSLGLKVIELPTHPITGVCLDALRKNLPKIKACCFMPSFSNPLGSLMPDENKEALVRLLTHHEVPLIEDDIFGNLYFGTSRPKPCKFFDEAGIVLWCSSVSKTLAPGYRVGWVAPGRYKDKIIRQKLLQTNSTPSLFQEVIADFLENGRYNQHLRDFRNTLKSNCLNFQRAIEDYFPENTKVSQPQGGLALWLEFEQQVDTASLFDVAVRQNISFAPGRMFTQHDQYNNCMRLNFALLWNDELETDIKRLGKILRSAYS